MRIGKVEGRMMARIEKDDYIFEVNYDTLVVKDVVLAFYRNGERVGSIYNDDGTKRTMARLEPVGEEDFISTRVSKSFVKKVISESKTEGMIDRDSSSVEAYKKRMNIE